MSHPVLPSLPPSLGPPPRRFFKITQPLPLLALPFERTGRHTKLDGAGVSDGREGGREGEREGKGGWMSKIDDTFSSFSSYERRLLVAMVGLPARGKSYIVQLLSRYLKWCHIQVKVFNVGEYRRRVSKQGGREGGREGGLPARTKYEKLCSPALVPVPEMVPFQSVTVFNVGEYRRRKVRREGREGGREGGRKGWRMIARKYTIAQFFLPPSLTAPFLRSV